MTKDDALKKAKQTDKLKALILLISGLAKDDETFGMVKLNKILFNVDFKAFSNWGRSVTEHEYQALENGPALRRMVGIVAEMDRDGSLEVRSEPVIDYKRDRPVALREANAGLFSEEELNLIREEIAAAWGKSADEMILLSHDYPGWKVARIGETIPYETVIAMDHPRPLTGRERRIGLELIEQVGERA